GANPAVGPAGVYFVQARPWQLWQSSSRLWSSLLPPQRDLHRTERAGPARRARARHRERRPGDALHGARRRRSRARPEVARPGPPYPVCGRWLWLGMDLRAARPAALLRMVDARPSLGPGSLSRAEARPRFEL